MSNSSELDVFAGIAGKTLEQEALENSSFDSQADFNIYFFSAIGSSSIKTRFSSGQPATTAHGFAGGPKGLLYIGDLSQSGNQDHPAPIEFIIAHEMGHQLFFRDDVQEHSEYWVQNNYVGSNEAPDIDRGLMHAAYIEDKTGLILKAETERLAEFFDE